MTDFLGVVLSISRHRYALLARSVFLALSGLGLVCGIISNTKTADLYEGNAHHPVGWIAMSMVAVHVLTDVLLRFTKWSRRRGAESAGLSFRPLINRVHRGTCSRRPDITGQVGGTPCPSISQGHLSGNRLRSNSADDDDNEVGDDEDEHKSLVPSHQPFLWNAFDHKQFFRRPRGPTLYQIPRLLKFLYKAIDWTVLVVGYVTLVTGGVTYTGISVSGQ